MVKLAPVYAGMALQTPPEQIYPALYRPYASENLVRDLA